MPFDSDVALLGTGVAPLIAASYLLQQRKSVLLLNPDWDFFLEDSELPLDPMLPGIPSPQQLKQASPEKALQVLRSYFPGAIEFWSSHTDSQGFHDETAPHVRQRGRLWISRSGFSGREKNQLWSWEQLEDLYVGASDANLNPQILEGLPAVHKFPGFSAQSGNFRGLFLPKLSDVDVVRFRNGLLEFIRERVEPERIVCAANQIERMPEGLRFHYQGTLRNAKLNHGMLVFWTPRLTSWVMAQSKKIEVSPKLPKGIRLWEQWTLDSREPSDPSVVGMYGDMAVWAEIEGRPPHHSVHRNSPRSLSPHRISVLRSGPLVPVDSMNLPRGGMNWASADSFNSLSHLCHKFLKWERFSMSALKARAIFEWGNEESWLLSKSDPQMRVIPNCDGPLVNVVQVAQSACDHLLEGK
jgi:hypothetical protein